MANKKKLFTLDEKALEIDDIDFVGTQEEMSHAERERMHRETSKILAALRAKEAKKNARKKK